LEAWGKDMLPSDLYSKWDDVETFEAETKTVHDAGAERTEKPDDVQGKKQRASQCV
jgi:hypothetical protein